MKKLVILVMISLMILGLAACGSNGEEETSDALVVYSAGPGGLAERINEGFEEKTGIPVEMFQGTTGAILGRLEAEESNPHADVVVLASYPIGLDLLDKGWLLQYEPENGDKLHEGWNWDNYFFGYSASALGVTYNTDNISESEAGTDWTDYVNPEFEGIVAIPDPAASGSALDFLAGYLYVNGEEGWDLFEGLKENNIEVAGANRPALDSVITSSNYLVMAGVDYMAYDVKAQGEPIDIVYPSSGTVVNPRPAMILNSSNNVENAKLFIDYLLSDEAQQLVADSYILPGRSDISAHPDRVQYEDINVFDIDWEWMAENQQDINAQFQQIMR